MREFYIKVPIEDKDIEKIKIGDIVYFTGKAWTCRSMLLKYVFDEKNDLPFVTKDKNLLIHAGPVIIKQDDKWKLISLMPTSSIRFEKWGPESIKKFGLKAIVGKTTMRKPSQNIMKERICIHATPIGVSPNLYLDKIVVKEVYWLEELGSIEAAWILQLTNLGPFLVDIDSKGNNYFDNIDFCRFQNKKKAYQKLDIPMNFEYTKLY